MIDKCPDHPHTTHGRPTENGYFSWPCPVYLDTLPTEPQALGPEWVDVPLTEEGTVIFTAPLGCGCEYCQDDVEGGDVPEWTL